MKTLRVLAIGGSLRQASTNLGLLRYARDNAPQGMEIELADLTEVPFYNQDLTDKPASVKQLLSQLETADALLLACPEYNYSMAPALKNALDWASREPDNRLLAGKPVAILGSGGGMGTARAQYHLRQVCVFLDLHPLNKPEVFVNAFAGHFEPDGTLVGEQPRQQVKDILEKLGEWGRTLGW